MERKNTTFKKEASSTMYKTKSNKKMDTLDRKKEKSAILQNRKLHFNNKGIVKDTKDLKTTLLKDKKIFLKSSSKINSLSISTNSKVPMKVSIESLSKQTNKEDNDKEILSLQKELSNLQSEISSIDKAKKDNEKILTKKNEEFICQTALLNHKQNKLSLIKEINTKLSERCKALQAEYDKLSSEQEQPTTISLNELLAHLQQGEEEETLNELLAHLQQGEEEEEEEIEEDDEGLTEEEIGKLDSTFYKNTNEEEVDCVICGFELCNNDIVIKLPKCEHEFHKECILNYLIRRKKCPVCKENVI